MKCNSCRESKQLFASGLSRGTTNRLVLTAAAGGSTITGLSGATDGFSILINNPSTTDTITFTHLDAASASANQFSNMNAATVQIPPLGAASAVYIVNKWQFA